MGIAWTKPSYGINVMWQLFSCSVVERFNIDNLFQRWNLENPCVFRTFLLFVKNRKTGEASLEWVWPGMWKQRLSTHVPEKLITMWSTVSSRSSACKVPHVCLWNNAGCSRENWGLGQKGMVSFNVKRGTLNWINCLNTAPAYEMPGKSRQTSHGYIHLKLF